MKDETDHLIDEVMTVKQVYDMVGVYYSTSHNFPCPHHADDTPSAKMFEDHVFCFAERKNYWASDALKSLDGGIYRKVKREVLLRYPDRKPKPIRGQSPPLMNIEVLDYFRAGASFDVVLNYLGTLAR